MSYICGKSSKLEIYNMRSFMDRLRYLNRSKFEFILPHHTPDLTKIV